MGQSSSGGLMSSSDEGAPNTPPESPPLDPVSSQPGALGPASGVPHAAGSSLQHNPAATTSSSAADMDPLDAWSLAVYAHTTYPDKLAVVDCATNPARTYSYRQLTSRAAQLALGLYPLLQQQPSPASSYHTASPAGSTDGGAATTQITPPASPTPPSPEPSTHTPALSSHPLPLGGPSSRPSSPQTSTDAAPAVARIALMSRNCMEVSGPSYPGPLWRMHAICRGAAMVPTLSTG